MVSKVALRAWHIAWLRYITLSLSEICETIQQNTIFYIFFRGEENYVSLFISSCSKLTGCRSERKPRCAFEDDRRRFNAMTSMDETFNLNL